MSNELKPCPFCGDDGLSFGQHFPYVVCEKCGAMGPGNSDQTEAEAIEAWNTRAERTCHNVSESEYSFRCSECDATDLDFQYPDFCHGCGAKVVEND